MEKKDRAKLKRLEEEYCISLKSFLISYCGIWKKEFLETNLTHKDVKVLFPYLKRTSFDYVLENVREIYVGNIFLVKDAIGNVVPYIKPKFYKLTEEEYEEIRTIGSSKQEKTQDDTFYKVVELEELSLYELCQLAKKYKEDGRINEYRKVCRIIKRNDDVISKKEYQKKKVLMEGIDKNDKY